MLSRKTWRLAPSFTIPLHALPVGVGFVDDIVKES